MFSVIHEKCHNPGRLCLTPPSSSSPSGLSSDVDGRLRATKLSNAAETLAIFVCFPLMQPATHTHTHKKQNSPANNPALPAVEPVLASIALDHKLGHVVR